MAVELATAYVSILPEMRRVAPAVRREFGAVEAEAEASGRRSGQKYSKGLGGVIASGASKIFAPIAGAAIGAAAIDFFGGAIKGASDLAESTNKMRNVFGTATKDVERFAAGGAKALGMTKLQAREAATTFGVFGKAANLTGPALAKFSTDTTKLATDLASFHNTSPEEAIEAIGAALRGESEPIRRYGILLDDASMRQQALSMGLIKTTKEALTPQQKVLAAHALILKQSKDAQNDFAETSDGLANKQRILSASFSDFRARIGEMLLPMATFATDLGVRAVDGISKLVSGLGQGQGVMTAFKGALDAAVKSPFGQWVAQLVRDILDKLTPAFATVKDMVMRDLIPAFMSFVKALVTVVNSPFVGWILNVLKPVFMGFIDGVIRAVTGLVTFITGVFNFFAGLLTGDWGRMWEGAKSIVSGAVQFVVGIVQAGLIGKVLGPLQGWFTKTIPGALGTMRTWFTSTFSGIWSFVSGVWSRILGGVFQPIANWLRTLFPSALGVFSGAASRVFGFFGTIVNTAKRVATAAFDGIVAGLKQLGVWADRIVKGIGITFDKIKGAIETPVKYVANTIIRDKLAGAWNAVAEKLNLPRWEFAGWRAGGWTGPGAADKPAGIVHADEYVIRKKSQRKLRRERPGLLDYLNRWGELPPGYAGGGLVYRSMAAWLKKNLPGVAITSSYRPGAITSSGNRSYHSMGMALDISPSMRAFNVIAATFGPSIAELIFTPAGARQIKNGRPHGGIYRGAVAAQHYCVPTDVEILTRRGWVRYSDLVVGDETPGLNPATGETEWTRVTAVNVFDDATVLLAGNNRGWQTRSTAGHRWVTQLTSGGAYGFTTTGQRSATPWLVAAPLADGPGLPISDDEAELLGWLLTDGSQWSAGVACSFDGCDNPARGRGLCGSHRKQQRDGVELHPLRVYPYGAKPDGSVFVWQTKPEGVARLEHLLAGNAGWNGKGFRLRDAYAADLLARAGVRHVKDADDMLAAILAMTARQRQLMLAGVIGGDGSYVGLKATTPVDDVLAGHANRWKVFQDAGPLLDVMSTLVYLCGYRPRTYRRRFTDGLVRNGENMGLSISRPRVSTDRREPEPVGNMTVWCPTTELGTWTAKDGDVTYLTGNSHVHWAMRSPVGDVPPGAAGDLTADGGFTIANPIAEALKKLIGPLFNGARGLIDGLTGLFGNGEAAKMAGAFAKKPVDAVEKWLREKIDQIFPAMFADAAADALGDTGSSTGGVWGAVRDAAARYGWGAGANWSALQWIINRESGGNPNAKNPRSTAYGLFQFLDTTWASVGARKTSDPAGQAAAGMRYIKQRYGTPVNAQAFWRSHGWYQDGGRVAPVDHVEIMDSGGILRPGVSLVHNYTGKPETIRTWEQEQALMRGGTRITINGIKHDSVGEFAAELNFALLRASGRSRYAEVMG